jgi:hypothetical protein
MLRRVGIPTLIEGASESERHVQMLLGLQPATPALVSKMLLHLHGMIVLEEQAVAQDDAHYWGYLRLLAHLLETKAIEPRDPRLGHVRLRCHGAMQGFEGTRLLHVKRVSIPTIFGELLPETWFAGSDYSLADMPPQEACGWDGVSPVAMELFLSRLGCSSPRLVSPGGQTDLFVAIDVSKLYGQDVTDTLRFEAHHTELLRSGRIRVFSTSGRNRIASAPNDCFMPYMVEDEELPVVWLNPSIPPQECRLGQPLYDVMKYLGVKPKPDPQYFLRAIMRVGAADTVEQLGSMPAYHRLRNANDGAELSETEFGLLKMRLVKRLLDGLRREDVDDVRRAMYTRPGDTPFTLKLPCETEQGYVRLPVQDMFLLDSYAEAGMSEARRRGYSTAVSILEGVRSTTHDNVGYLDHRQVLRVLGANCDFTVDHVVRALKRAKRLHQEARERGQNRRGAEERKGPEPEEAQAEEPDADQDRLEAMMIALYHCLEEMLEEMDEQAREERFDRLWLLAAAGLCRLARECIVPDTDVYKQRLSELARARKQNLAWVSPALLGLGRVLSASLTQAECVPWVLVSFEVRPISDFILTDDLTKAIKEGLGKAGLSAPALQIAVFYDFQLGSMERSGPWLNPNYMLLKHYQVNVEPAHLEQLSMNRDGGEEASVLLVLKLNPRNHIQYLGTVSEAFTRLLHASLAMLLRSQYGWEAGRAMQVAGDIVVAANKQVPDALVPSATTTIRVQKLHSLEVPYESIFLPPQDKVHGTENCLVLPWHEPADRTRSTTTHQTSLVFPPHTSATQTRDRPDSPPIIPRKREPEELECRVFPDKRKQNEMTTEEYLEKLEQGVQAERYAHEFFAREVPGYDPRTCWLSKSKKRVLSQGDLGAINESAGNPFNI